MSDFDKILDAVSKTTGISRAEMLSRSRLWPIVEARLLYVLICSSFGMRDSVAASVLRRKRVTILKARHRAQDYISYSKTFSEKYNKILSLL